MTYEQAISLREDDVIESSHIKGTVTSSWSQGTGKVAVKDTRPNGQTHSLSLEELGGFNRVPIGTIVIFDQKEQE